MNVFSNIEDIRKQRWIDRSATWGLVPTMGFLHEGHLSLIRRARNENERVGVSIFVNPKQFNDHQDLVQYPQDLDRDLELLAQEGVDLVWTPDSQQVYPSDYQTYIDVEKVTRRLEGHARPGHFRGVTTVVAKLLNVFQPQRAYFGEKDAQQLVTIRQMVRDLNFGLEVVACATVRETDGLAMSSRNVNLSPKARREATCLYKALLSAKIALESGERITSQIKARMLASLEAFEMARLEYISIADPKTLDELDEVIGETLVSLAVFVDGVRLIDNMSLMATDQTMTT